MEESYNSVLYYIKRNVPFYFKYMNEEWQDLPIINKMLIRDRYSDFVNVCIEQNKREQIISILNDKSIVGTSSHNELCMLDDLIFEETTGTSGQPFRVVKSIPERIRMGKILWEYRKNIDPEIDSSHYYLFNHTSLGKENPNVYNYNKQHILDIYRNVIDKKARWIHTSVVPLLKHIEILESTKMQYNFSNLRFIELTGNFVTEEQIGIIEDFFQAKVLNFYGCIETWGIAYPCINDFLQICKDNVYVELIDDEGHVIESIGKIGRVVVTTLCNKIMPLIRYDTGDFAKYKEINGGKYEPHTIIELQEGREINYIKGIKEKKLGTKQFGNILTYVKREKNLSELEYIQFVQVEENKFVVYMNNWDEQGEVAEVIKRITCERLEKRVELKFIYLTEKEIEERKYEKPNLFLCKC